MLANILSPLTYCLRCSHLQKWRLCTVPFASTSALPMRNGVATAFACLPFAVIQHDHDTYLELTLGSF